MKNQIVGLPKAFPKISFADFSVLLKTGLVGFVLAEIWFFSQALARPLIAFVLNWSFEYKPLVILALYIGLAGTALFYAWIRGAHIAIVRLFKSCRLDLLVILLIGAAISISFSGVGMSKYVKLAAKLDHFQILALLSLPLGIGALLVLRLLISEYFSAPEPNCRSFFISDKELQSSEDDLLDFKDEVERFSERLLNGGAPDSIVFGLDSPWGIGKSTFVNFCIEYLDRQHRGKFIIYKFDPLRYEDRTNLPEKFIDGLVHAIRKQVFVPEIQPLISRYARFIKGKVGFNVFGIKFDPNPYDIDDALTDLEVALTRARKKIIVIVDDLDRIGFSAIKDVLFAIKKSFTLPNVSYVLCYDTENILALEKKPDDVEKVREFLEKFVNVKISLFLDTNVLAKYVTENFEKAVGTNLQVDPTTLGKIKGVLDVLVKIYQSSDYHHYQFFLSDVRKLKRLINAVMLIEIEQTDFENSDFNKRDLLHLLLIYINYPNVFRKIYDTETDGKNGFFSVVRKYDANYPDSDGDRSDKGEKNSTLYANYLKSLENEEGQRFLLNKIFAYPNRIEEADEADESALSDEAQRSTFACFNGSGGGRNLEAHLKLIVRLSKPQRGEDYMYYLSQFKKIVDGKKSIEDVLSENEFAPLKGEKRHQEFWRIAVNGARSVNGKEGDKLIEYLMSHIEVHALLHIEKIGIGFRDSICYRLIKLLDVIGYAGEAGGHANNTDKNVMRIAERIFGEKDFVGMGIIETLSQESRGVLGIYDLLLFRLQCSADRGGDIFNLTRALSLHESPDNPTTGIVVNIAIAGMREISQQVFRIFEKHYIESKQNLFDAIDGLSLDELTGKFNVCVERGIKDGEISKEDVEKAVAATKSRMKGFMVYQLGNTLVSSGVGCGYYDETGRTDQHGIAKRMNDYLFGECFNGTNNPRNYEHFLDYLFMNFSSEFFFEDGQQYSHKPRIEEFTKVLNRERLAKYWDENKAQINALNSQWTDRVVHTLNYSVAYSERLVDVFSVLDSLLTPPAAQVVPAGV